MVGDDVNRLPAGIQQLPDAVADFADQGRDVVGQFPSVVVAVVVNVAVFAPAIAPGVAVR